VRAEFDVVLSSASPSPVWLVVVLPLVVLLPELLVLLL
jgi:hypothetical protein